MAQHEVKPSLALIFPDAWFSYQRRGVILDENYA